MKPMKRRKWAWISAGLSALVISLLVIATTSRSQLDRDIEFIAQRYGLLQIESWPVSNVVDGSSIQVRYVFGAEIPAEKLQELDAALEILLSAHGFSIDAGRSWDSSFTGISNVLLRTWLKRGSANEVTHMVDRSEYVYDEDGKRGMAVVTIGLSTKDRSVWEQVRDWFKMNWAPPGPKL